MPNFKFNILSVSGITNTSNLRILFYSDKFCIQELVHKKVIGRGKNCNGLYVLDNSNCDDYSLVVTADIWHSRLGHPSKKYMSLLCNKLNCNIDDMNKEFPCYVCPLAKQRKLPFNKHTSFAVNKFDLIHCDTWSPYHIQSHSKHRYFLTLVDDKTRFTCIYLMK